MSGHSKWSGIKHKKAVVDAQRNKVFSKVAREITVAARMGGGDPNANPHLRLAVTKARESNMPKDTIEKAIQRGTGELPGVTYEEMVLEGYAPGGVALLIEGLTDNKNRTTAELRSLITRHGGSVAGAGSVSWQFQKKGVITLDATDLNEDRLTEIALEAGAEDLKVEDAQATITTDPQAFEAVKRVLQERKMAWTAAELAMVPSATVKVDDPSQAKNLLALLDALEDHDDTQHIYANFDIPDAILEQQAAG